MLKQLEMTSRLEEICLNHERIIKWTQHIGFLTLDGMARVVQGELWERF